MPRLKLDDEVAGDLSPNRGHTLAQVNAAIAEIRRCLKLGRDALRQKRRRSTSPVGDRGTAGTRVSAIVSRYRYVAARYTPEEIENVFKQLRERRYAMGFYHLIALASLTPKNAVGRQARENLKRRRDLEHRCIDGRMGHRHLQRIILREMGKRRQGGGRPIELPFEMTVAVSRLHEAAESFGRLCEAVARPDERTEAAVEGLSPESRRTALDNMAARGKGGSLLSQMAPQRRKLIFEARETLMKLARELAKG